MKQRTDMYSERIRKLQSTLTEGQGVLVSSVSNRLYFTGLESSAGLLLVGVHSASLVVDSRYYEQAEKAVSCAEVVLETQLVDNINSLCVQWSIATLLADISSMSTAQFLRLQLGLTAQLVSDSTADAAIAQQRAVKSQFELESLQTAQKLTDDCFSYILGEIGAGVTEREIMIKMGLYMESHGSENRSFDFIVISGDRTSLPHGRASDRKIGQGEFVMMDFGFVINGYHSDCTRTVAVGEVTPMQRAIYQTVLEAQQCAIDAAAPNVICSDVDAAARDYIAAAGYGSCFGHGLGHSLGLDVHENPRFNQIDRTVLRENMVITVEPGIYIPEQFGVRIEDMIRITADGCCNMTACSKELIIL